MSVCSQFYPDWFQYSWNELDERGPLKEAVPHDFDVAKGSTHMAVTREFVEFAVNDSRAQNLLNWMRDIKVPDEHFFQTLNHSPKMQIPGSFIGQCYCSTYFITRATPQVSGRRQSYPSHHTHAPTFYSSVIVTIALSCTIFELFDVE